MRCSCASPEGAGCISIPRSSHRSFWSLQTLPAHGFKTALSTLQPVTICSQPHLKRSDTSQRLCEHSCSTCTSVKRAPAPQQHSLLECRCPAKRHPRLKFSDSRQNLVTLIRTQMAMSQHFHEGDPFWPAALLAGSLPTGHLEQRQQQPAVRGIPIDVVEVSRLFVSCRHQLAREQASCDVRNVLGLVFPRFETSPCHSRSLHEAELVAIVSDASYWHMVRWIGAVTPALDDSLWHIPATMGTDHVTKHRCSPSRLLYTCAAAA